MDKFDILVKLHQIQTSAIDDNNQELQMFVSTIFDGLTLADLEKYYERLGKAMANLTPRAPDRLRRGPLARIGKFFVRLGYLLVRNGGR